MKIEAQAFNRLVERVLAGMPFRGARVLVTPRRGGYLISLANGSEWRHPWFTDPFFDAQLGQWFARVRPGFVNGVDPLAPPDIADDRDEPAQIPLADRPRIALRDFRPVGNGEGDEAPAFFQALGVRPNDAGGLRVSESGVRFDATDRTEVFGARRFLRACDVVLSIARPSLRGDVTVVDEVGTSGQQVLYRVAVDSSRLEQVGNRARLRVEQRFIPPVIPTLADRLLGNYIDDNEDRRLVSTVFLLSPPGGDDAPPVDGSWTPFVQHRLFWNLNHSPRNLPPVEPPRPIRLFTGLLGGIGDQLGNAILSQINEFSDRASNAINEVSSEGRFWSHGSAAAALDLDTSPEAERPTRLEPDFPFEGVPFDPFFFGVANDPEPPGAE